MFEIQADTRPDAVAVVFEHRKITYAELEIRAYRLAHHLRREGVGTGSVVATLLPSSLDAYVASLSIMNDGDVNDDMHV